MELIMLGVDYPHRRGEFCQRITHSFYTVSCFCTPFRYLCGGELLDGDVWDILINPPGSTVYHGPQKEAEEGFRNDWFYIAGEDLGTLLEKYPLPQDTAFSVGRSHPLRKFAEKLNSEFSADRPGREDYINCLITEMIVDTYRAYTEARDTEYSHPVAAIHREILLDPQRARTLGEMAKKSGYSVSRFSEIYVRMYGKSPIIDLIDQRIALAKRLLISGQTSVMGVSEAAGFSSVGYVSRCFKRSTGYTPGEYARTFR